MNLLNILNILILETAEQNQDEERDDVIRHTDSPTIGAYLVSNPGSVQSRKSLLKADNCAYPFEQELLFTGEESVEVSETSTSKQMEVEQEIVVDESFEHSDTETAEQNQDEERDDVIRHTDSPTIGAYLVSNPGSVQSRRSLLKAETCAYPFEQELLFTGEESVEVSETSTSKQMEVEQEVVVDESFEHSEHSDTETAEQNQDEERDDVIRHTDSPTIGAYLVSNPGSVQSRKSLLKADNCAYPFEQELLFTGEESVEVSETSTSKQMEVEQEIVVDESFEHSDTGNSRTKSR
ncbi:hypothetical protein GEMRC1_006085 [Eukaryota sp. GEM-RC1]